MSSFDQLDKQGHRGCRGLMPENTIPAMLKAIDLGVTTLEMDLAISKDRHIVVSHDPHLNEDITTMPDGSYLTSLEAQNYLLYERAYDTIRKYDVGLKPHPDFPQQKKMPAHKPLLSDLIEQAENYAMQKGRTIFYNIEIKSKPENDGVKHPPVEEFVDLAMAVINEKGIATRTTIQSFDTRALQVLRRKYSTIVSSLLIEEDDHRPLAEQIRELGFNPTIYSPHFSLVNDGLVAECKRSNIKVIPWTVNDIKEMQRLVGLGVDGIITDYPDLFEQL